MRASDPPKSRGRDGSVLRRLLTVMLAALVLVATLTGVLLFPLLLGRLLSPDGDYSRISDIDQAYGVASAMISALALAVVVFGQYRQAHRGRLQALSEMTDELVRLAMDEPMYRQCWGARMAPDDIDEALFYYCNRMIKSWKAAWELRDLSEAQARAYLASFFQSEIPRLFWRQHGQWQMQAPSRSRHDRFVVMIIEEYLRAIHAGTPVRPRELGQPERRAPKRPRRHLVDADNINDRPTVP